MPITIVANDLPKQMHPEQYDAAIREAMCLATDDCQVYVVKLEDRFGVEVTIAGSKGTWSREFLGLQATPAHIYRTLKNDCPRD